MYKIFIISALLLFVFSGCSEVKTVTHPESSHSTIDESETVSTNKNIPPSNSPIPTAPSYKIIKSNDISTGSARRYEYFVVPDDVKLDESGIKSIAAEVTKQAKDAHDFSAIVIWYLDHPTAIEIGDPYTIAKAEYAPNGIWSNAVLAKPGDYKGFDYKYYLGSSSSGKLPKDNPDYPSTKELDIYFQFKKTHRPGEADAIAYEQIAKSLSVSEDEVRSAVLKGLTR